MLAYRLATLRILAILVCAGFSFARAESAQSPGVTVLAQCQGKYGGLACLATILRNGVELKSEPRDDANVLMTLPMGYLVPLPEPFESLEHPGWVMTRAIHEGRGVRAWVRRSGVLFAWEFFRVVGCWPVSHLNWYEEGAGEYGGGTFRPRFDLSGNLISHKEDKRNLYKEYALYYAGGVFFLRNPRDPGDRLTPSF